MCAIKEAQAVLVGGEVGGNPIQNDADVGLMAGVYKGHELLRRAKTAGRGKKAGHLVAPGTVKGVFGNGHQFDVGKAHFLNVWD